MPCKNQSDWNARRSFIIEKSDLLLREHSGINSIREAYQFIAENCLFCDISTVYRAVEVYNSSSKQASIFPTSQISFNF